MSEFRPTVIVGGGLAGFAVAREIRRLEADHPLMMVTADEGHFYSKPALSTALVKQKSLDALVTTPALRMSELLRLEIRRSARSGRSIARHKCYGPARVRSHTATWYWHWAHLQRRLLHC